MLWNKICSIFVYIKLSLMKKTFKNGKIYKILTGNTKTVQVSSSAVNIVFDRNLSAQVYSKLDNSKEFSVEKDGKRYIVRQLQTM
jgi:hypothetical protein